ncbi:hypothetical protein [Sphingobium sp. MK2]|uniref:hypothetical protein n=1 Tax=Sphingobium sp. MK2 TaxID=3116540 RepID=UPI00386A38FC
MTDPCDACHRQHGGSQYSGLDKQLSPCGLARQSHQHQKADHGSSDRHILGEKDILGQTNTRLCDGE